MSISANIKYSIRNPPMAISMKFRLVFLFSFPYFTALSQIKEIKVESDWISIVDKSVKESKPIFLDFYTDWCTPCKKMDKTVFVDSTVIYKLNSSFISAKINAETEFGKKLKKSFNVSAYPTYTFINDGIVPYYFIVGFRDKVKFHSELDSAISQKNTTKTIDYYSLLYDKENSNPSFVRSYVDKLSYNGKDSLKYIILESYFSRNRRIDFTKNENLELLASYVKDCESYMFDTLEFYVNNDNKSVDIKGKLLQAYQASIKNCLKRSIAKKDSILFDKALNSTKLDQSNLNVEYTIMNLRLKFYDKTDQKEKYYFWVKYYANSKLAITEDTLRKEGLAAYNKIYKNRLNDNIDKDMFIRNWIKADLETLAGDLNYFSQIYYNELKNKADIQSALSWSERACELTPTGDNFNTYAHILYKLGKRSEAIIKQKKAVDTTVKNTKESLFYARELEDMVNNRDVSPTL